MNPHLRIGDAERESAIAALGEHFAAGRIDQAEYEERSSAAWAARTTDALSPLFDDLPAPGPTAPDARREGTSPQSTRRSRLGWVRLGPPLLIGLLIALAVVTRLPWFLVLIGIWILCFGGPRHRHWGRHPGWQRRARW